MPKRIVFLHTVLPAVELFHGLAREMLPADVEAVHILDEMLARLVIARGGLYPFLYRRVADHIIAAEEAGAALLQCTCSSISPCLDAARSLVGIPALKIDEAMLARALSLGRRIAVAATVPTALRPVVELLETQAGMAGLSIETEAALCQGAYEALFSGRPAEHDRIVGEALRTLMERNDVVLLAQVSMARVADTIPAGERPAPLLAPHRLALERARELLIGEEG